MYFLVNINNSLCIFTKKSYEKINDKYGNRFISHYPF